MKINKKTKFSEILENKKAVEILFSKGLYCVGCPMASQESIEEGCKAHGMDDEDIDKMLKEMNNE